MNVRPSVARIAIVSILFGAVLMSGCGAKTSTGTPADHKVEIKDMKFNPLDLSVKVGQTVEWTNEDAVVHSVDSDDGTTELDSQLLSKGQKYKHTFNQVGTFKYKCTPHDSMKGTVTVTAA